MPDRNFLVVGVGGQGTVLSGDILAEVGMSAGYDAKKSDVLGLAVRSGSVVSHIRWGAEVFAPMSMRGTVDYLLAFEPLEALRVLPYLRRDSTIIVNEYRIPPVSVLTGQVAYPSAQEMRQAMDASAKKVYGFDATRKAKDLGSVRTVNVLLLGALSSLLEVRPAIWKKIITKYVPDKYRELNLHAFHEGRNLIQAK